MRERSSSVLYPIKHSYSRFKWLKNYPSDEFIGEVQVHVTPRGRWGGELVLEQFCREMLAILTTLPPREKKYVIQQKITENYENITEKLYKFR